VDGEGVLHVLHPQILPDAFQLGAGMCIVLVLCPMGFHASQRLGEEGEKEERR
jgi:hypothetical protein